jgi:hypothetical protein
MAASFHSFNLASMVQQLIPCLTAIGFGPHFITHPPHPILKLDSFGVY